MADESISSRVARCLLAFDDLRTTLRIDAGQYSKIIQISSISDEQGRFRVWSGNVGAHRTGLNSLNYRLRDASHLHRNVVSLLIDLEQKLRDALDIVTGKRVPWDALSESDSESGSIAAEDEGSEPKSEVEQLFQAVTEIVSCLMRLSLTTTNPAPHDQLSQTPSDASHFEQADIQKVRARFPGAPAFLTKRLGNSITRRREYLKYRQDACKANPQVLSKAPKSRSFFRSRPSQRLNDRGPEIEDKEDLYDSDSSSANDKSPVLITPMPNGFTYGDKFTCPLCLMTIEVSSVKVWNKHVKSDLSPYICTQENCINPTQTFESRNEWFEHELQYHRRRWQCVDGCSESYYDTWSFNAHILQSHEEHFSTTDREKILRLCETQLEGDSSADCDLCGKTQSSLSQLKSHMAKHQEEIAVMALRSEVPPRSATILGRQAPKLQHRQGTKREIKTLFLGPGESGKTTLLKQYRRRFTTGFTKTERMMWRSIIFSNIVSAFQLILTAMEDLGLELDDSPDWRFATEIAKDPEIQLDDPMPHSLKEAFTKLWAHRGVQLAVAEGHQYALHDNLSYYMDNLDRLFADTYLPSEQDIFRTRLRTTGISETIFEFANSVTRVFDMGGQRSERKKWIYAFENVDVVVFFASLPGFKNCLVEDRDANQMSEALMLWESISNSRYFSDAKLIVVLNKMDIFDQIGYVERPNFFSDLTGDKETQLEYFTQKFRSLAPKNKNIHVLHTSLVDESLANHAMDYVHSVATQ